MLTGFNDGEMPATYAVTETDMRFMRGIH